MTECDPQNCSTRDIMKVQIEAVTRDNEETRTELKEVRTELGHTREELVSASTLLMSVGKQMKNYTDNNQYQHTALFDKADKLNDKVMKKITGKDVVYVITFGITVLYFLIKLGVLGV